MDNVRGCHFIQRYTDYDHLNVWCVLCILHGNNYKYSCKAVHQSRVTFLIIERAFYRLLKHFYENKSGIKRGFPCFFEGKVENRGRSPRISTLRSGSWGTLANVNE